MKLHEHQAKELLRDYGLPVPLGVVCLSPPEARKACEAMGPVVIKAQVLVGGRGKAGGVKVARNPDEAEMIAGNILGMDIKGLTVGKVLVEPALEIADEIYVGVTTDRAGRCNSLMISAAGGVDIEQVAEETPEKIARIRINPALGLRDFQVRQAVFQAGLRPEVIAAAPKILQGLYKAYIALDANLAEINPLVVTSDGQVIAADAKIVIDENAEFRQSALEKYKDTSADDPLEAKAKEIGLNYVRLFGTVGIMGNGAGLVMTALDEVKRAGAEPANFLDIGGGAKADIVTAGLGLILSDANITVLMINIFGGITRCDEVARGIVAARKTLDIRIPQVVRLTGTNEEEGREILRGADGITPAGTMEEAASTAARLASTGR